MRVGTRCRRQWGWCAWWLCCWARVRRVKTGRLRLLAAAERVVEGGVGGLEVEQELTHLLVVELIAGLHRDHQRKPGPSQKRCVISKVVWRAVRVVWCRLSCLRVCRVPMLSLGESTSDGLWPCPRSWARVRIFGSATRTGQSRGDEPMAQPPPTTTNNHTWT